MKKIILTAAILGFGVATLSPAFAEANNVPFDNLHFSVTRGVPPVSANGYAQRDVGSEQFPSIAGRPGTELTRLGNDQVLSNQSNEQPVQTANSLPRGFEEGTVAYAQAKSMNSWMVAHNLAKPSALASR